MAEIVTVYIWKEGDGRFRSSIQEDTPVDYAFPEPFWSEYLKKKEIPPCHLALFGEALFRSAFNSLNREEMVREILSGLKQEHLTFSIKSSEEIIHEVPWELMKPPGQSFLGSMGNISFARALPGHRPGGRPSSPPYRILVILSLPVETYEEAPLDPLRELENLYRALDDFVQKGLVRIDVCLRASVPEIRARMIKAQYDVIHFIGHGGPGGLLILEDEADFTRSHETTNEDITYLFGDLGVQAVILNACHTQSGTFFDPSLALFIYKTGIPVVLANQASVEDQDAIQAARSIYECMFEGQSLTPLLDMARLRIREDWWKPVLFTRDELKGEDLFLPPAKMPEAVEGEKVFQDLGTLETARVYVYRYRPLREITQHLAEDRKVIVLHGIGGAGKSFMADYLARFLRPEFAHVVALDMKALKETGDASIQGIRDRILSIFENHEIIGGEKGEKVRSSRAFSLFWKRLNQALGNVPWLLILDNFEIFQDEWGVVKDQEIHDMLRVLRGPDWAGRLLITSRLILYLDTRRSLEPVVEIGTYDEAEKRFFLGQLSKKEQRSLLDQVSFLEDVLGWHPLATDLLLKNPSAQPESIVDQRPLKEVLDFYKPYVEGYPRAFGRLCALKHPMSPELPGLILKDADLIDLLVRRLRLISEWNSLMRLHPIFHFVFTQACQLSENDRIDLTGDLASFEPQGLPDNFNRMEVLEGALSLPEFSDEQKKRLKEKIAEDSSRIGESLIEQGRMDLSISYVKKSLLLRKELFGEKHPDVATSYNNLGMVYRARGQLDQAISYHEKSLVLSKELFGEKHPYVATSYNNLGGVYEARGQLDQAITYHNKALALRKELFGEKHPDVATSYNNLGGVYYAKGDLDQAISYHEKAQHIWKALGSRKAELRLCSRLSKLYIRSGRKRKAAKSLCSGISLLEFLRTDSDTGLWMGQAFQLFELAEKLKTELEAEEFYNCRKIIQQYQDELGPLLE
ncbi:MAG: tetratricopeptide repeat protein, partial [Proteobacteria bacterium]|nr:tetratricopeptide repeat protein [Pseudomonadota bacterium]